MVENEFRRPISTDTAPRGSLCEWCGKPATLQLTAIGGTSHNNSGRFCRKCGEKFSYAVAQAAAVVRPTNYHAR